VLMIVTLWEDFEVGLPIKISLCVIAAYIVASDAAIRLLRSLKT
jgi:phosphatidylcholine synthase